MSLMKRLMQPFSSFRGRLLGVVSLGILSLALTASITAALVTGQRAAEQMIAQGLKNIETLASQSILSLLYESPANAEKPLETILSFPGIEKAGIFHSDLSPLIIKGEENILLENLSSQLPLKQARLLKETNQAWHFIAPVVVEFSEDLFPLDEPDISSPTQIELLGYCYMVMNKETLRDLQITMILNNIFIALSFAIVLSTLVNLGIDRMMQPLYKLIDIMEKNEQEQTRVYAELTGPKEITHIASVFNRMMSSLDERDRKLRQHGEQLETMVQLRTRELVTARDAALTANRHKSQFLANMSHELRTPLQAIIGYADIAKEELELDGFHEQSEGLERVIRNATRLLTMINGILDMAKAESGKMDLQMELVFLPDLLQEPVDSVMPILRHNNNRFNWHDNSSTHELEIDREKLLQIVINLLSNAGKFTQNGTVDLHSNLSGSQLLLTVTDTGIGLSESDQKFIFDEFRQVDGSTTRNFEGTGLGLAITKRFVEEMGGSIEVDSTPGQGASFSLHIPLPLKPSTIAVETGIETNDNAPPI
ncbi:Signal transduction histidine kinase [Malonomonas rubra DSM 5091]|uniref:histidine kinase n=1 Tax=Malonomonas rubra DSM 5091 TaxID=1122189 RepID=A0A1M6BHB8_MALRU|nr:ATP-binding protein [Malonomonas rubra]SHI48111.1 Signal transduction histidine kinase [Malonomonas rubra DSM 5091]